MDKKSAPPKKTGALVTGSNGKTRKPRVDDPVRPMCVYCSTDSHPVYMGAKKTEKTQPGSGGVAPYRLHAITRVYCPVCNWSTVVRNYSILRARHRAAQLGDDSSGITPPR